MSNAALFCTVYKSLRKDQTYVFVPAGSALDTLPDPLAKLLGDLDKVLDVELTPEKALARADAVEVMKQITESGFYVQMPPGKEEFSMAGMSSEAAVLSEALLK